MSTKATDGNFEMTRQIALVNYSCKYSFLPRPHQFQQRTPEHRPSISHRLIICFHHFPKHQNETVKICFLVTELVRNRAEQTPQYILFETATSLLTFQVSYTRFIRRKNASRSIRILLMLAGTD